VILIIGTAVLSGIAGAILAPWLARFAEHPSGWLDRRLIMSVSAVAGAAAAVFATGPVELITFAALAVGCGWLALVDLAVFRLPDRLVGPLYLIAIVGLSVRAVSDHDGRRLLLALISGAVLLIGYFLLGLITGRLGLGDVKLAGLLGIALGWAGLPETALGTLGGFALGAVMAVALLLTRRASRKADFPFGPAMIIGATLGLAFGPAIFPALT
jgi:leader peptidase (prepilin peptidase) / N-methyltransferase